MPAERTSYTLTARDHDGAEITFTDFVEDGQRVDLWKDPDLERGFLGARIVVRDGDEWFLRELTEQERLAPLRGTP